MPVKRILSVAALLVLLAACGATPEPVVETIVETVEVEKEVTVVETVEVEKEVTVVETVEVPVEKEVTVIETVVVEAEAPEQLSFAGHQYFNVSFGPTVAPLEMMRERVAEEYPNIEIQLIMQPLDANKWHDNYTTYFLAEDPTVDILYYAGYWNTEFGEAGWLMPLNDIIKPEIQEQFDPELQAPFIYEGQILGMGPGWGGISGLFYRSDLLDEYGLEPPETYDDIITACDTILADLPDMTCWTWPAMRNVVLVNRWSEFLHGFGGRYVNEDGTCAMNSPEAVAALEFIVKLFNDGYTPEEALSWKEEDSNVRFASGDAVFHTGQNSMLTWIDNPDNSQVTGRWGFIANPAQPGGRHSGFTEFWAFGINKYSDNAEDAAKVIELWSELPVQKTFALAWGPFQGNMNVYQDPEVLEYNEYLPVLQEVAKSALAPLPSANYGEIADILQTEVHSALSGLATPQEALDNACASIEAIEVGP